MPSVSPSLLCSLLDEHSSALLLYSRQWCNDPEDVVQEAFLRLMAQADAPTNVVGWLYRVVRNESISAARRDARRARHESSQPRQPWFREDNDNRLDAELATRQLASLPEQQREIVVLRIWSGLSFDEIGEVVGLSSSTVHRHYQSALRQLQKHWSVTDTSREG